jgi:hypothetical protein
VTRPLSARSQQLRSAPSPLRVRLRAESGCEHEVQRLVCPDESERSVVCEGCGAVVMRASDVQPGMRVVDGRWFYSAAWL